MSNPRGRQFEDVCGEIPCRCLSFFCVLSVLQGLACRCLVGVISWLHFFQLNILEMQVVYPSNDIHF